jgi:L-iditol 2-dehydrogenase
MHRKRTMQARFPGLARNPRQRQRRRHHPPEVRSPLRPAHRRAAVRAGRLTLTAEWALMRVARFHAAGDLRLEEAPEPAPGPGDLVAQVRNCSVCGTDLKIVTHGHHRIAGPRILGHEIAGEVTRTGPEVTGWRPGDRIQVAAATGCGRCRDCAAGAMNMCPDLRTFGYDFDGGFARFLLVPAWVLAAGGVSRIPDHVSFAEASAAEPLACAVNAQDLAGVGSGDDVAVIGAGPAGCMHARLARARGAGRVFLADLRSTGRLAAAAALVAPDAALDAGAADLADQVLRLTAGRGADVVIVCAASGVAQEQALRMAARRGRVSLFAGLPKGCGAVSLDTNLIHYRQLCVVGATSATPAQNAAALDLIAAGRAAVADLITHRFGLADIHAALDVIKQGTAIKATIEP